MEIPLDRVRITKVERVLSVAPVFDPRPGDNFESFPLSEEEPVELDVLDFDPSSVDLPEDAIGFRLEPSVNIEFTLDGQAFAFSGDAHGNDDFAARPYIYYFRNGEFVTRRQVSKDDRESGRCEKSDKIFVRSSGGLCYGFRDRHLVEVY